MAHELTGKLIKKMPVQSGSTDRGGWSRQDIIVETPGQYPRTVCISLWGDRVNDAGRFNEGDTLKVSFELQSREYNGRWYTDVRAWRIEREGAATTPPATAGESTLPPQPAATADPFAAGPTAQPEVDDLPF